ncbi:hypothetical protein [Streptomyces sp. MP131-18]|uniref:hypothetical protein n=1 Tax=Streptomyces sp. MP131-18 TaxID=1857892 RepID=UPI00097C39C1|nr:hypothetical protein [Streptomyces sp. MP131-18]ONK16145.1 hypothetical protein STBA_69950 [Streptomyces sp. MP131-18]
MAVPLLSLVIAGGVAAALWTSAGTGILVLLTAPVIAWLFGSLRVVVGESGVLVRMGHLGWPKRRVPFADIVGVEAGHISALSMGGWGYRVRGRTTAFVVRSGNGLVLALRSGRRPAITCRDASTGPR